MLYIEVNHLIIKYIEKDNYVVNNTVTNRYIRLGTREINYLLDILNYSDLKNDIRHVPLSNIQKEHLNKKFDEWGFLKKKEKKKENFDFSNIILFSVDSNGWIKCLLKVINKLISPIGLGLFVLSILSILYIFTFKGEVILLGLKQLKITIYDGILLYILSFVTSVIHELFHAAACYKYSGSCGKMGIKLYYMLPAYFCDVSNIYMVDGNKKPFVVASMGLISNHMMGVISLIIYITLYNIGIVNPFFLLYYCLNLSSIIFNLIPFAKFDGYWMLKALLKMDNLYDNSIIFFYMFIFKCKKLCSIQLPTIKKIFITVYGGMVFIFHWILWVLGIFSIYSLIKNNLHNNKIILFIGLCFLIVIGVFSSFKFTKKYFKMYKNY